MLVLIHSAMLDSCACAEGYTLSTLVNLKDEMVLRAKGDAHPITTCSHTSHHSVVLYSTQYKQMLEHC
jgi:hypothetical protein